MENDLMMVQGVAGSGKTSVALHRAAYLMYRGLSAKLGAENIMIISPNSLFERYIAHVLPELGEEHVRSAVPEEIFAAVLGNDRMMSRNQFLEELIAAPSGLQKSAMAFKTSAEMKTLLDRFAEDIPHRLLPFKDVFVGEKKLFSQEELKEKLRAARTETPLGIRLNQLEEFILETLRETAKERGLRPDYGTVKKEIRQFTAPEVKPLYEALFDDKAYFFRLAQGLALPENIGEIIAFTRENLCGGRLAFDDASALAYLHMKLYRTSPYQNIKQVVIDEAQDYYPLHFALFHLLFPAAKYTVLGDINQTLEKTEDITLYDTIAAILNKKKSTLVTLNKSFRCTNEILAFSRKFIGCDMPVKSFNRSGDIPQIKTADSRADYLRLIKEDVTAALAQGCGSVGLIVKTEKHAVALYDDLKALPGLKIIKNGSSEETRGVFVIPVYLSKGLEFDAVLVCDADDETYCAAEDKKLLYIAATRALHRLRFFSQGRASRFLY
jgi:DNA helicase-2/ATP-dependent DNA helicase PcrA